MQYQRHCPKCGQRLVYTRKGSRDRADRENLLCKTCNLLGKKGNKNWVEDKVEMNPGKRFIYFPSFSSKAPLFKADKIRLGDIPTIRFYDDRFPEKFRHKYFLLSAGMCLEKRTNQREDLGLQNSTVFCDSGGFQIANGTLEWSEELRDRIFKFLIENGDIAMNLDIPPKLKYFGHFDECLDLSYNNFKYFENKIEKENIKTKFLNVIQMDVSEETYDVWYDKMKNFHFKGWGIGGTLRQHYNALYVTALFLKNREFEKKHNEYIHFLGATNPFNFLIYAVLQKNFNKYYPHLTVTTDSSTPLLQPVYGNWAHSINLKAWNFNYVWVGNKNQVKYNKEARLPCILDGCPVCSNISYNNIANYKTHSEYSIQVGWHNLFIFIKGIDWISDLVYGGNDVIQGLFTPDIIKFIKSIDEMFRKPEDAMKIFSKYKMLYSKLSNSMETGASKTILSQDSLFTLDGEVQADNIVIDENLSEEERIMAFDKEGEADDEEPVEAGHIITDI